MSPRIVATVATARPAVDIRAVLHTVGRLCAWFSPTLLVPGAVAVWYGESITPFLAALAIGLVIGIGMVRATRGAAEIGIREGFLVVALAWLIVAAIGSLPYIFEDGDIARPVDAYFEAMSGFTTTGSSQMADIESHGRGILFWRALTQWLGGMGIIVLALAILPRLSGGGRALMENEAPGPGFDKLSPRIRDTAKRLWVLYVWFTLAEIVLLCAVGYGGLSDGMDLYMAVTHSFTTMATGGFSPDGRSLEQFGPWSQWIVIAFMAIAGVNFALWWRALFRSRRVLWRDEELRLYLGILLAVSGLVAVEQYLGDTYGLHGSIRHALFQVVSMMTTTGFASVDFVSWPQLSLFLLVALMFVGGCAGSTSGSIKVVRVQIVARALRREVRATLHPEAVMPVRSSRQAVPEAAVRAALVFTLLYLVVFLAGVLVLLIDAAIGGPEVGVFEVLAAAACTIGNIGPGLGFAGPMGSFAPFGDVSTVTMTILMWTGRLELLPVLVLLSRWYWRR